MARSRFVQPDTKRLELSDGDWLIVKSQLSTGDQREAIRRTARRGDGNRTGQLDIDPTETGMSLVTAYLLDWSFCDAQGLPAVIRGLSAEAKVSFLDALDPESFAEILTAIQQHDAALAAARAARKADPFGASSSSAT